MSNASKLFQSKKCLQIEQEVIFFSEKATLKETWKWEEYGSWQKTTFGDFFRPFQRHFFPASTRVRLKQSLRLGREDLCQYNSFFFASPHLQIQTTEVKKGKGKIGKRVRYAKNEREKRE